MSLTLNEIREREMEELKKRRDKEREELKNDLVATLKDDSIEVLSIQEDDDNYDYYYKVEIAFTIDGFRQEDSFYWRGDESKEKFVTKVKQHIEYIKELREQYPEYCQQNDFIQTNSKFRKEIKLTHMGYARTFSLELELADYLKLPNTTSCSFGGGDYQIKRTPKRVEEYNKNIDIAIDALLDCIAELKRRKYRK